MNRSTLAHFKTVATILGVMLVLFLVVSFPGYAALAFGGVCFLMAYSALYISFTYKGPSDPDDNGPP